MLFICTCIWPAVCCPNWIRTPVFPWDLSHSELKCMCYYLKAGTKDIELGAPIQKPEVLFFSHDERWSCHSDCSG